MTTKNHQQRLLSFNNSDFKLHKTVTKYHGFFKLDEYFVSHKCYDGSHSKVISREVFERDDAVVLMPYDPVNDCVVLIEQFRVGALRSKMQPWLLEFIAGMFEGNESPVDVAIREAYEESGLEIKPSQITEIMKYLSSPGGMSETIHLYLAIINSTGVGGTHGLAEENEDILVHVLPRIEAIELLQQGKITNAATIIGLQWLSLNYRSLQPNK